MMKTLVKISIWFDSLLFLLVMPRWNYIITFIVSIAYTILKYIIGISPIGALIAPIISSVAYSIIIAQGHWMGWLFLAISLILNCAIIISGLRHPEE